VEDEHDIARRGWEELSSSRVNYDIMTFVGCSKRKGSAMDKVASRDKKTAALSDILIYIEEQIQNWNIDLCA